MADELCGEHKLPALYINKEDGGVWQFGRSICDDEEYTS